MTDFENIRALPGFTPETHTPAGDHSRLVHMTRDGALMVAGVTFQPAIWDNGPWFTAREIATVAGYRSAKRATHNLYQKAKGRFHESDTRLKMIEVQGGGCSTVRLFNARALLLMVTLPNLQSLVTRRIRTALTKASPSGAVDVDALLAGVDLDPAISSAAPGAATRQNSGDVVTFEDAALRIIDQNGEPWFTGPDIGRALGYEDANSNINKLYQRLAGEFTEEETCMVTVAMQGDIQAREHRVFSRRGMHRLAMSARTARAKAFREWVLDLLEGKAELPGYARQIAEPPAPAVPSEGHQRALALLLDLQPRWQEVLHFAGLGLTVGQICKLLDISEATLQQDKEQLRSLGFDVPSNVGRPMRRDPLALLRLPTGTARSARHH